MILGVMMTDIIKKSPHLEWVTSDPAESFRWQTHDFPCNIARWNYHPEHEIHLIRRSTGKAFVGDYIGEFGPGCLTVVGPNLPHNWVSDLEPGEVVERRDVVIQFDARAALRFHKLESPLHAPDSMNLPICTGVDDGRLSAADALLCPPDPVQLRRDEFMNPPGARAHRR